MVSAYTAATKKCATTNLEFVPITRYVTIRLSTGGTIEFVPVSVMDPTRKIYNGKYHYYILELNHESFKEHLAARHEPEKQ